MNFSKNNQTKLKIFAWYQILGGVLGIGLTLYALYNIFAGQFWASSNALLVILYLLLSLLIVLAVSIYCLAVFSGWKIWKGEYQQCLKWSFVVQYLQIPDFTSSYFSYLLVCGLGLVVGLKFGSGHIGFWFKSYLGSKFNFNFGTPVDAISVGVNVVPIFFLWWLRRVKNRALPDSQ